MSEIALPGQQIISLPPAAGPDPGQPGHFAHHDWLESAVLALDSALSGLRIAAGTVSCTANNATTTNQVTVTWPEGVFTTTPKVFVQSIGSSIWIGYLPTGPTAVGCTVAASNRDGLQASVTIGVNWLAIQVP